MEDKYIINAVQEASLLRLFKNFCEKNWSAQKQRHIRNIYNNSSNALETTYNIILNEMGKELDDSQCKRMYKLIIAFLSKSSFRAPISLSVRRSLLQKQNYKCAICGCKLTDKAPVDHIVPFKYVGDALEDNYQMLCTHCNSTKNASIDYQINILLTM